MRILSAGRFAITVLVCGASTAQAQSNKVPDSSFEYHGYMRSGIGGSRGGSDQVCFKAPGSEAKFRLGNECETYIESEFVHVQPMATGSNAPTFKTHVLFATVSGQGKDWESTSAVSIKAADGSSTIGQNLTIAMREAFVEASNVLGSARPWVGKRFYQRQDIHILDYYVINNSGPGAGIENIDVGAFKLQLAMTRDNAGASNDGPDQTNVDVRLTEIPLASVGQLEFLVLQGSAGKLGHSSGLAKFEAVNGTQFGLVHTYGTAGFDHRLTLQYGTGLFGADGDPKNRSILLSTYGGDGNQAIAKGASAELTARNQSRATRAVWELLAKPSKQSSADFVLVYQNADFGGYKDAAGNDEPAKTEIQAGVRPVIGLTPTTALAFEYGYTQVTNGIAVSSAEAKTASYKNASLQKFTVAPQIVAGDSFWARPQLRLFATYAMWNDDSKGGVGGSEYAGSTSGFSTGAQFEAWW